MLIILDGWGEQIADEFNAIHVAKTPIMDYLKTVIISSFLVLYAYAFQIILNTVHLHFIAPILDSFPIQFVQVKERHLIKVQL